jgi:hypothetical protein
MNRSKSVLGLSWEGGAIGNATWSGARLTDVLASLGVDINDPRIKHVQFEGADHGADGSPYGKFLCFLCFLDIIVNPPLIVFIAFYGPTKTI